MRVPGQRLYLTNFNFNLNSIYYFLFCFLVVLLVNNLMSFLLLEIAISRCLKNKIDEGLWKQPLKSFS